MKVFVLGLLVLGVVLCEDRHQELQNILSLVQTGRSPAQLIVDHIDQLIFSVRSEQLGHEEVFTVQQGECNEETSFRTKEVSDSIEALKRSEERRRKCQTALTYAQSDIVTVTKYQTLFREEVEFISANRDKDSFSFKKSADNLNFVLETLEKADQIINDWSNNQASFIQVTQHLNKLFIQTAKVGLASEIAPLMTILLESQQAGQVSEDQGQRLHTLVQSIRDKLLATQAELTQEENDSIEEFNNRRRRDEDLLVQIGLLLDHLKNYIVESKQCLVVEADINNAATAKKVRNQSVLDYANDLCSAFQANLDSGSGDRTTEVDTLQKLRKFVLAKADQFGQFTGDQLDEIFSGRKDITSFVQLAANTLRFKH